MSAPSQQHHQEPPRHPKERLKMISAPDRGPIVSAPPILIASTHTVDYGCAICGTVLLHAEPGQIHNLVIYCNKCGNYNSTDT